MQISVSVQSMLMRNKRDECKSDVKNPSTSVVNCPIFYDRINQEKLTLGINLKSTIVSHLCIIQNSSWQASIKPLSPRLYHRLNEEKAVSSLFFWFTVYPTLCDHSDTHFHMLDLDWTKVFVVCCSWCYLMG